MTYLKINVKALEDEEWDAKNIIYNSDDEAGAFEE
jgi:hypothetical protein